MYVQRKSGSSQDQSACEVSTKLERLKRSFETDRLVAAVEVVVEPNGSYASLKHGTSLNSKC